MNIASTWSQGLATPLKRGLLVLGVAIAFVAALPSLAGLFGWQPYIVQGYSMSPTMSPGSLVWTRAVPAEQVGMGDVVVFDAAWAASGSVPTRVVHRVVALMPAEGGVLAYTRGDGSRVFDPAPTLLHTEARLVTVTVPLAGHLYQHLGTIVALLLAGAVALVLSAHRPIPAPTPVAATA